MIILAIAAAASAAVPALPPGWKDAITKGDMLYTADALPTKLLPSVENGFLGGTLNAQAVLGVAPERSTSLGSILATATDQTHVLRSPTLWRRPSALLRRQVRYRYQQQRPTNSH